MLVALVYLAVVAMFVGWLWGVIRSVQAQSIGWLLAMIVLPPVAWFYLLNTPKPIKSGGRTR